MNSVKKVLSIFALSLVLSVAVPPKRSEALVLGLATQNWGVAGGGAALILVSFLVARDHYGSRPSPPIGISTALFWIGLVLDEESEQYLEFSGEGMEQIQVEDDLIFYGSRGERILSELRILDQKLAQSEQAALDAGKEVQPVSIGIPKAIFKNVYEGIPYDRQTLEQYECGLISKVHARVSKIVNNGVPVEKQKPILFDTAKYLIEASSPINSELTAEQIQEMQNERTCRYDGE